MAVSRAGRCFTRGCTVRYPGGQTDPPATRGTLTRRRNHHQENGVVDVQYKYDGLRTQIHKDGQKVSIFSRNLENISQMFPEIIEGTRKQVPADSVITKLLAKEQLYEIEYKKKQ